MRLPQVREAMSADVASDWHVRKRWYTRFCEVALFKLKKPELMYELMRNRQVGGWDAGMCAWRVRPRSCMLQPLPEATWPMCFNTCTRMHLCKDGAG